MCCICFLMKDCYFMIKVYSSLCQECEYFVIIILSSASWFFFLFAVLQEDLHLSYRFLWGFDDQVVICHICLLPFDFTVLVSLISSSDLPYHFTHLSTNEDLVPTVLFYIAISQVVLLIFKSRHNYSQIPTLTEILSQLVLSHVDLRMSIDFVVTPTILWDD